MSAVSSHACSTTAKSVAESLQFFSLAELYFILHEDSKVCRLDRARIKKISDGVRYMYGGNQSDDEVATVVNGLSDAFAQCLPLQKRMSLSSIATRRSLQPMITPFSTVCPTCSASLSAADAKQRSVKVYGRNGSVVGGQ
jgi:hypothetical protein